MKEKYQKIIQLLNQDKTYKQVRQETGVSQTTIAKVVKIYPDHLLSKTQSQNNSKARKISESTTIRENSHPIVPEKVVKPEKPDKDVLHVIKKIGSENEKLSIENEKLLEENKRLLNENEQLTTDINKLSGGENQKDKKINQLTNQLKDMTKNYQKNVNASTENAELRKLVEQYKQESSNLKRINQNQVFEIESLKDKIELKNEKIDDLKADLNESKQEIEQLQDKIENLRSENLEKQLQMIRNS